MSYLYMRMEEFEKREKMENFVWMEILMEGLNPDKY